MAPRTVVMVSCNAATAARDAKWLTEHGYKAVEVQPGGSVSEDEACGVRGEDGARIKEVEMYNGDT